ncbi:MAG: hypothetical protein AB7O38_25140 [Pirellulaceae bacterium]
MKRMTVFALVAALACASSAALAFEEQQMKPAAPASGGTSAVVPNTGGDGLQIATPDLAAPKSESGVKIRLPGLGVIGEIPKMDFGLELLYGASQPKQLEGDQSEASGVMVRGRLPIKSR